MLSRLLHLLSGPVGQLFLQGEPTARGEKTLLLCQHGSYIVAESRLQVVTHAVQAAGRMGAAAGASDGDKWRTGVVRGWPTAPIGRSHSIDEGPEGPTTSPPCPCIP